MHYFNLVILLCLAQKGLILFTLVSISHLPLRIRIYAKNRLFKQNNGYEDALSCPWMDFFLLFSFGTLLWNMIFVQEEIGQTLSLSEASLRLSSDFIHKSVWGIRIYLWNECLIFYSHLVFLQQFMSLWITVFCKSCAVSCKNLWMENVGSVVLLLHILQRQNDDLIYFKSASWDSSSNGNGRTFSQATCNQCKIRKLSSFLIGRLWKFWSFAKYSCYWFAILTGVCFSFKEEPGKR